MADADALSVDELCDFGAENFNRCTEFIQCCHLSESNTSLLISHFGVFGLVVGSVMVRIGKNASCRGVCLFVKPAPFAGMLPSCRLVRRPSEGALS